MKYILTENKVQSLVKKIMDANFPEFNRMDCYVSEGRLDAVRYFVGNETEIEYAVYYIQDEELKINRDVWITFTDILGDEFLGYLLNWFNEEFDEDAQSITF